MGFRKSEDKRQDLRQGWEDGPVEGHAGKGGTPWVAEAATGLRTEEWNWSDWLQPSGLGGSREKAPDRKAVTQRAAGRVPSWQGAPARN